MDRENITIQLDADVLQKLNLYAELDKKSQSEFISELLDSALNNYFLLLTGGMVLTIPNPQFYHINKYDAYEKLALIHHVADECNMANIPSGLYALENYFKARIIEDSEAQRQLFKNNLELIKK